MSITQFRDFAHSQPLEVWRFIKFATVGALGSITHFAIDNILILLFRIPFVFANPVGFGAAVVQNFVLNRLWTFPESQSRSAKRQLTQFTIISVIGLLINQGVALAVRYLLGPTWVRVIGSEQLGSLVNDNFALAFAIGVVLIWNFAANRIWTYRGL
ncbi:GtrA family protein [Chloroflexi bacterium TSY]|nr:GtrA family protein [Chloroflexi bacterium TSY]